VLGTPRIGLGGVLDLADGLGGFFVVRGPEGSRAATKRWLRWALGGDLAGFAADLRWRDGRRRPQRCRSTRRSTPSRALHEGGRGRRRRLATAVPIAELWSQWHEFREQLGARDGV